MSPAAFGNLSGEWNKRFRLKMLSKFLLNQIACFLLIPFLLNSKSSDDLVLEHADQNTNEYQAGNLVTEFSGRVRFKYQKARLDCNKAIYFSGREYYEFSPLVRITTATQTLQAEKMIYQKTAKSLEAMKNLIFHDKNNHFIITGEHATYLRELEYGLIDQKPVMIKTLKNKDTLTITGKTVEYFAKQKTTVVRGEVMIQKKSVVAHCDSVTYFAAAERFVLKGHPQVQYQKHHLKGDTIELRMDEEVLQQIVVIHNGEGRYFETDSLTRETLSITKLFGDTMLVFFKADTVDKIFLFQNATGWYFKPADGEDQMNTVKGKILRLFTKHQEVDYLKAEGEASGTYFNHGKTADENGKNEVSGDTLMFYLKNGKMRSVEVIGGTEGTYYPQGTY